MALPQDYRGTLERLDLGTGAWALRADDGTRYTLHGAIPAALEGRAVRVQARPAALFGFGMAGPALEVLAIEAAPLRGS